MQTTVNGVTCEYQAVKAGDADTVLFLHGWGGDLNSFAGAYSAAAEWGVNCINFAFPKTVPESWSVYDYAACVRTFLIEVGAENPIIVGHSFGGRIALILAAQGLCKKLVLTDAAGLNPRFSLRKKLKIAAYHRRVKCGKPLDGFGSVDYNNLDPKMRAVFVRIVNARLDRLLPFIKCKTLIFWGKDDRDTPLYMARRIEKAVKDCALITLHGGHYAYVDNMPTFHRILEAFL